MKFLQMLCHEKKMRPSNLIGYMVPLISHMFFDKLSTTKHHNLLSEAIVTLGVIVTRLTWSKYYFILKTYLRLLRKEDANQKTIGRYGWH